MTTPYDEAPVRLPADVSPPEELERRVLQGMRKRGLIRRTTRTPGIPWLTGALAAALAAFAAGWWFGQAGPPARPVATAGQQYLLLLSSTVTRSFSPSERGSLVQEYVQWAEDLDAAGRLVAAEELAPGGVTVWRDVVKPVQVDVNTPGGFFLVTARDSADALAIVRDSPHWRYGGTIAVRPIRND